MTIGLNLLAPAAIGTVSRIAGGIVDILKCEDCEGHDKPKSLEEQLAALDPKKADKARKTAEDFESVFLENVLNTVFANTGSEGPLGNNGTGGDTYKQLLVNEYARSITKSGGVGIANDVLAEIIRLQESAGAKA